MISGTSLVISLEKERYFVIGIFIILCLYAFEIISRKGKDENKVK